MANVDLLSYFVPLENTVISYDGKIFDDQINKKSLIGSRVSYADVTLHSFKVNSSISDEELQTNVEIKLYEDAGLDLEKKYKIIYIKKELDFEENILVEAFAIEIDKVTESLSGVLAKTKHIDFLALPFLSFTTLYKNKIIESQNDLFVYMDEHEAFVSIYKDGKYLSTKSLIDLNDIVKKLNSVGIEINTSELKQHLKEKGLDASLYERGESTLFNELEAQFSSIFTKINDIVVYNRSVFGFEKIDRIFFSMQDGRIKGLREFVDAFGFDNIKVNDFNLFKEKKDKNFLEMIVTSYIYDKLEEKDFRHNVTLFQREAAFYKKESGKVILFAFAVIFFSLLYSGSVFLKNIELEKYNNVLQDRYDAMKKTESKYKQKIKTLNEELKSVKEEVEGSKKRVKNISLSISSLESLQDTKYNYSSFIKEVNRLLAKNNLASTNISLDGENQMSIDIVAQYTKRDSITKFMEDLIDKGFIGIKTDEIKSDKDIYLSKIEIKK